jgi:hypothetical protein
MKLINQIVAATVLLLVLGASGADCLVPNARMSDAEKMCCQQMAGQCDMSMAAKHPCCQKIVQRHDDAYLKNLPHFTFPSLSLQVATLDSFDPEMLTPSFVVLQQLRRPPPDPPVPSIEILRV